MINLILAGILIITLSLPSDAAGTVYRISQLNGKNQVRFFSETTLEDFEGKAHEISGLIKVNFSKKNLELEGKIDIPVMSMSTGILKRDVHMRSKDWLNENRYPLISFEIGPAKEQVVTKKGKNKWFIKSSGRITIKNRSQKIEIPLTLERKKKKKKDLIIIKGGFVVNLDEFNIHGPREMKIIGARVSPDIKVSLKLIGKSLLGEKHK